MIFGSLQPATRIASLAVLTLLAACTSNGGRKFSDVPPYQREASSRAEQSDGQKRAAIRLQLAMGYYEQRQLEVALDEIKQALSSAPDYADAHSVRALIYTEMGEKDLAEESFQRALRLSPNNPDYLNNYGWFLCRTGQESRAIANFEAALQSPAYQSPGKALTNAGICSLKRNDFIAADRYLLQAFRYEPGNPAVSHNLAKIYYENGNDERAKFYINRVVKLDSATAEMFWLAIKLERRLGDRPAEESLVTQLSRRFPNSHEFAAYQRGAFNE